MFIMLIFSMLVKIHQKIKSMMNFSQNELDKMIENGLINTIFSFLFGEIEEDDLELENRRKL